MMFWQVDRGRPTRLVELTDMIWSPMLTQPDFSAGPACIMFAMMTVGRMEPHPLSTMTTPSISPFAFSIQTWWEDSAQRSAHSEWNVEWNRGGSAVPASVKGTYVFAVLRLGEVCELIVVHVLVFQQLTVLLLTQILCVDAIGQQELLVGHTEGLSNRLGYELGLVTKV